MLHLKNVFPQQWRTLHTEHCCEVRSGSFSAVRVLSVILHDRFNLVSQGVETWPLVEVVRPALLHQTVHLAVREEYEMWFCRAWKMGPHDKDYLFKKKKKKTFRKTNIFGRCHTWSLFKIKKSFISPEMGKFAILQQQKDIKKFFGQLMLPLLVISTIISSVVSLTDSNIIIKACISWICDCKKKKPTCPTPVWTLFILITLSPAIFFSPTRGPRTFILFPHPPVAQLSWSLEPPCQPTYLF